MVFLSAVMSSIKEIGRYLSVEASVFLPTKSDLKTQSAKIIRGRLYEENKRYDGDYFLPNPPVKLEHFSQKLHKLLKDKENRWVT